MFVCSSNSFVYWWSITNRFVNDLNRANREIGRIVSVEKVVASLAAFLTRSLPGMAEWPGIHWIKIEEEMELMELWMENV